MFESNLVKKQKLILQFAFVAFFVLSFVLVIFERNKVEAYQSLIKQTQEKMQQSIVKGMSIEREAAITDYHDIIKQSLITINANIDLILQSKDFSREEMDQVYNNLMKCKVPDLYKEMHIKIIALAKKIIESDYSNADYLISQRETLFARYGWLKQVVEK